MRREIRGLLRVRQRCSKLYLYEMNLDLGGETGQGGIKNASEERPSLARCANECPL